jgi:hypothetical protein
LGWPKPHAPNGYGHPHGPKHIEIDFHFVHDKVAAKTLAVRFISSNDNLDDIFIKPTATSPFSLMRTKLNIVCHLSHLRGGIIENLPYMEIIHQAHVMQRLQTHKESKSTHQCAATARLV